MGAATSSSRAGRVIVRRISGPEGSFMRVGSPDPGGRGARIRGVGAYRPQRSVSNNEIAGGLGVTPEWIVRRSGIRPRGFAGPDETLAAMSTVASERALSMAGVEAAAIDCVVVATVTHLSQMPALAPEIAHRLGARGAAAF